MQMFTPGSYITSTASYIAQLKNPAWLAVFIVKAIHGVGGIAMLLGGLLLGQILASASPQPVWDVRSFLTEPPRACHVQFTILAEWVAQNEETRPTSETVLAEGAWDGETFYVKLNQEHPRITGRDTTGTLWFVDTDPAQRFILRAHELDQTSQGSMAGVYAPGMKFQLDNVKTLGIHVLKPGTLKWTDATHFEGDLLEQLTSEPKTGLRVSGEATELSKDGRIAKIEYTWGGIPEGAACWVEYFYGQTLGQTLLPDTIVNVSQFKYLGRLSTTRHTNKLSLVRPEEGSVKGPGFQPEAFISTGSTSKVHTLVWSNGVTYETSSGKMNPIDPTKTATFMEKRRKPRRMVVTAILIVACGVFAGLVWRPWRSTRVVQ